MLLDFVPLLSILLLIKPFSALNCLEISYGMYSSQIISLVEKILRLQLSI